MHLYFTRWFDELELTFTSIAFSLILSIGPIQHLGLQFENVCDNEWGTSLSMYILYLFYLIQTCQAKGHLNKRWCSQPRFKFGQHAGDFALCCAILFTGNNYTKVATLLGALQLKPPSQPTYTRIHGHYAVSAVNSEWEECLEKTLENVDIDNVVLLGKFYIT